jgi:hypothetical protein
VDLVDEVEAKALRCMNKVIKAEDKYIPMSYDESDIFKPDAKKMQ